MKSLQCLNCSKFFNAHRRGIDLCPKCHRARQSENELELTLASLQNMQPFVIGLSGNLQQGLNAAAENIAVAMDKAVKDVLRGLESAAWRALEISQRKEKALERWKQLQAQQHFDFLFMADSDFAYLCLKCKKLEGTAWPFEDVYVSLDKAEEVYKLLEADVAKG